MVCTIVTLAVPACSSNVLELYCGFPKENIQIDLSGPLVITWADNRPVIVVTDNPTEGCEAIPSARCWDRCQNNFLLIFFSFGDTLSAPFEPRPSDLTGARRRIAGLTNHAAASIGRLRRAQTCQPLTAIEQRRQRH